MTDHALLEQMKNFERVVRERDAELARTVLHDDYALQLVVPTSAAMPRSRWLEVLPDYVVDVWEVEDERLDVMGDCATVLQRVRMIATVLGADRSGTFVVSDVWLRGDEGWRIWRRHSTPLQAGELPGVDGAAS